MRRTGCPSTTWYDFYDDFSLIEASIAQQYGIRLRKEIDNISWSEVKMLIAGLLPDTPLGNVIQVRSETNKEVLKNFTPEMHRIRNDWRAKLNQRAPTIDDEKRMEALEAMIAAAFG